MVWGACYGVGVGVGTLAASWEVCGIPAMIHWVSMSMYCWSSSLGGRHLGGWPGRFWDRARCARDQLK